MQQLQSNFNIFHPLCGREALDINPPQNPQNSLSLTEKGTIAQKYATHFAIIAGCLWG